MSHRILVLETDPLCAETSNKWLGSVIGNLAPMPSHIPLHGAIFARTAKHDVLVSTNLQSSRLLLDCYSTLVQTQRWPSGLAASLWVAVAKVSACSHVAARVTLRVTDRRVATEDAGRRAFAHVRLASLSCNKPVHARWRQGGGRTG